MNYEKLKTLLKDKKYSIAKASIAIGRTEAWFHRAIKNESMTISDLEKLLKLCKMSISEFFGSQPAIGMVNESSEKESELAIENNELLRENRKLRLRIEDLEGKKLVERPKAYK